MDKKPHYYRRRFFEILPGFLTWTALIVPIPLSAYYPWIVAIFVIAYDIYWLFRAIRMVNNIIKTYRYIRHDLKINWHDRLHHNEFPKVENGVETVANKYSADDMYHVIVMVRYKESYELVKASVESYIDSRVPKNRLWFIFACEERVGQEAIDTFEKLKEEFGSRFDLFIQTLHPAHIPGEIMGKSANETWAGKKLKEILDDKKLAYDQVILHNFDADTRTYTHYFDYVTYKYLEQPYNQPTSFQPVHIYSNNIWDVPAMMRIVAQSSSMIFMHNMLRPSRFHNFSSRSDIFKTIVDIGYWRVNAIPEDSGQYYDAYFYYAGRNVVLPMYIPLRMDAVLAEGYWRTIVNQYRQLRRWAWGIVDFSYIIEKSIKDKKISWWNKLGKIVRLLEGHFSWATAAFYITLIGWVPVTFNAKFTATVLGYNFPTVTRYILTLALIGMITGIVVNYLLLPPRPPHRSKWYYFNFLWQWILAPVVSIFLNAVAALDAQTRLMFGKYMEYQVTEKAVGKSRT